ncbi:MAG: ABC transporter permease [Eubacteriales bacterium]|nr:ABC transporter permease [Eubacteriales bacterium]
MKRQSFFSILFLVLVLIVMYVPVVTVVAYSFNANTARNPVAFTGFTFKWYNDLFSGTKGYGAALMVSLRVALMSTVLSVLIGTMGAIGMNQRALLLGKQSKGSAGLEALVTLPIMIPEIILAMAFMAIFYAMGLPFGELTLVLSHTTFCIPYLYLTVKSRLVGMDSALYDAARDLGASPRRVLWDITLPLCRPAILSGAFLAVAMSMDDFIISFFVYGSTAITLPVKIYSSVKVGVSPQINALCSVMIGVGFLAVAVSQYASSVKNARLRRRERMDRLRRLTHAN